MANYKTCRSCGAPLGGDDIAIYRKLVYRGAEDFLCIACLADYFRCPRRRSKSGSATTARAAPARCSADGAARALSGPARAQDF